MNNILLNALIHTWNNSCFFIGSNKQQIKAYGHDIMAGKTSLPTGWQTALENPAGCKPYIEVIIDPDGDAVTLTTTHSVQQIDNIINEFNPDPTVSSESILKDLNITFTDPDEYFAAFTGRASRYFKRINRITSQSTATNPVGLNTGLGEFAENDTVTISDGTNSESFTCNGDTATNFVGWDGSLSNTYAAGSQISSLPVTGNEVEVRLRLVGQSGYVVIFRGFVREPFQWDGTKAVLKLDNYLSKMFDKPMRICDISPTPTERATLSGNLETSLSWSTGATTSLYEVTVYEGARLGQWTITMGADVGGYYAYHVSGPGEIEDTGFTNADYYDGTDDTDSQIRIATGDWDTIQSGDILTFYVSANFVEKTVPEIVYQILHDYGDIEDGNIDVSPTGITDAGALTYSFNEAYNNLSSDTMTFSIDSEHTIIQAVMLMLPQSLCYIGQMLNGNLRMVVLDPDFAMASLTPTVIGNPTVSHSDIINEFIVNYAWDYSDSAEDNVKTKTWPDSDDTNASYDIHGRKVTETIMAPGLNS